MIGTTIFQIDLLETVKIGSKDGNSTKKILKKKWRNFVVLLQLFPFASIASFNFSLSFPLAGILHDIQNVDFIVPHKFKFSQILKGQFGKFLCLSHWEFPEVLEIPPTFISSPFQSGVIAKKNEKERFFGGHPVYD